MAARLFKSASTWLFSPLTKGVPRLINVIPVRFKTHRRLPTRKRVNSFVQRHTDLIKKLCISLIMHERIQTTKGKAKQLKRYGNLLVLATKRRQPPPDLHLIKNGFVLTDRDAREGMIKKRVINRRVKKVVIEPPALPEEMYVERLRNQIELMLLNDKSAIDKLYGTLAERYKDRYGNFVKVTLIPNSEHSLFPDMAYVEFVNNNLPALPDNEGLHYLDCDSTEKAPVPEDIEYESDYDDEEDEDDEEEKGERKGTDEEKIKDTQKKKSDVND